jgi:hypothetical protein
MLETVLTQSAERLLVMFYPECGDLFARAAPPEGSGSGKLAP